MNEMKFRITGLQGGIAAVVAVVLIIIRFMTIGDSEDPKLRKAVRAELTSRLGGITGEALSRVDEGDSDNAAAVVEDADPAGIKIHSTRVSKPLLSLGTKEKVIVLVDYSLPGKPARSEYWRFDHSLAAGYRYRGRSNVVSYYLNFF